MVKQIEIKTKKYAERFLIFIIVILTLSFNIYSMTSEELSKSYNYDFNRGIFNISTIADYMYDTNANGLNDTLSINLTLNISSGTYIFIADLGDNQKTISTSANITLTSTGANISILTELLNGTKFNYTIRIYNQSNVLLFRKDRVQSNIYENYEKGIAITSFTDRNVNNDYLEINLTLNVTRNQTANITLYLRLNNSNTIISSTKEQSLTQGLQNVSLIFDNETIKKTHHNGTYIINAVTIGEKIIDSNLATSSYSYDSFAKTSFIRSFLDDRRDTNANNLSEYLEINVTVEVKTADNYTITTKLYDEFDNLITNITQNASLTTGTKLIQLIINSTFIYASKLNGPYKLKSIELLRGTLSEDFIINPHTTKNYTFDNFESQLLPDLSIGISSAFNSANNQTNLNVSINNQGQAPAFNVFVDVFDNKTFEAANSTAFLDVGKSLMFYFTTFNETNDTLYTSIVDFDNLVEESNEENNIKQTSLKKFSIALISPNNNTLNTTNSNPIFAFNVSVDASCNLVINGTIYATNNSVNANTTTIFTQFLIDKSYSWKIECTNGGNNNESETRTLTIDDYNLTVNIKTINDSYIIGNKVNITDPPDEPQSILIGKASKIWDFTIVKQDELMATITQIDDTHFKIIPEVNSDFFSILKTYLPGYRWKLRTIIDGNPITIVESQKQGDLRKPITFSVPDGVNYFKITLGESSTEIDANAGSYATRPTHAEHICVDSSNYFHAVYEDDDISGDRLRYANSSNNGTSWSSKQLDTISSLDLTGILCDSSNNIFVYYENAGDIDIINSTTMGVNWSVASTLADGATGFSMASCVLDSQNVIHCCLITSSNTLYYVNSTNKDSEVIVNDNTTDDSVGCDIEVDSNKCVYIVAVGVDQDDIDLWSPCLNGLGDSKRIQVVDDSNTNNELNGPVIAIDNDNNIYVAHADQSHLQFCNASTYNKSIWQCKWLDNSTSTNPDIAVNENGDIYILYTDQQVSLGISEIYYTNSSDGSKGKNFSARTQLHTSSIFPSIADSNYPKSNRMTNLLRYIFPTAGVTLHFNNFTVPYTTTAIPLANQSRIKNEQSDSDDITFTMKVQFFNATLASWIDINTTYDNSTIKTISGGQTLKLDQYWQPWNSSNGNKGTGTYRAWIQLYDVYNNIIINNEGNSFDAYNFSFN